MQREAKPACVQPVREQGRPKAKKKLTYKEQREFDTMEESIGLAEAELARLAAALEDPTVASHPEELQKRLAEHEAAAAHADRLYARWAELEEKQIDDADEE